MTAQILQHVHELVTHTLGHPNLTTGKIDLSRVYITYHLMYDVENLSSVHDIVHTYIYIHALALASVIMDKQVTFGMKHHITVPILNVMNSYEEFEL